MEQLQYANRPTVTVAPKYNRGDGVRFLSSWKGLVEDYSTVYSNCLKPIKIVLYLNLGALEQLQYANPETNRPTVTVTPKYNRGDGIL